MVDAFQLTIGFRVNASDDLVLTWDRRKRVPVDHYLKTFLPGLSPIKRSFVGECLDITAIHRRLNGNGIAARAAYRRQKNGRGKSDAD